jgi:hypothetical protein
MMRVVLQVVRLTEGRNMGQGKLRYKRHPLHFFQSAEQIPLSEETQQTFGCSRRIPFQIVRAANLNYSDMTHDV